MKKDILLFLAFFMILASGCSKKDLKNTNPQESDSTEKEDNETYDDIILKDDPVGYWPLGKGAVEDLTKYHHGGEYKGGTTTETVLPNGDQAKVFNGVDSYFEISDAKHLRLTETGVLTIEVWMRPDVVNFPNVEKNKDYIYWMGKGGPGNYSWALRMYNKDSWRENRPQRISGYIWNLEGGLGAGSYFQDNIPEHSWVFVALVINTKNTSTKYPTGYTKIYKNGKLRDQDDLAGYNIIPGKSTAPVRVGTRNLGSFFKGAIAKVAIFNYELPQNEIYKHYSKMEDH